VLTGVSNTVRDSRKPIHLTAQWDRRQAAGVTRLTSALLHDSTVGIQHSCPTAGITTRIMTPPQTLFAQDTINIAMTGSAVAGDIEHMCMLVEYDDLPGVSARFISPSELSRRGKNHFSNTIVISSGTSGQFTGSVAINSAQDQFKANTDYALIGYVVDANSAAAIRYVGPDWGNLGLGGPGYVQNELWDTSTWFYDLGVIPVMNSSNKALTTIDCVQDENGGDPSVTTMWVELS
jgi:hypothetical protein